MGRHHVMLMGLLGPVTQTPVPARVRGVQQCGGEVIPTACPHCHCEPPGWTRGKKEGHCRMCGEDFYLTRYEVGPPFSRRSGNPHPVPPS